MYTEIQIRDNLTQNRHSVHTGVLLADKYLTDEAVEAAARRTKRQLRWLACLGFLGLAVVALWLMNNAVDTGVLVLGGTCIAAALLFRSALADDSDLLDALKTRPDVCLCLDRLAGKCPSVRAYVKEINTSGRVLRLFHAAKAQMIYYKARRQVQKDREEAAVGRVHAITT